MPQNTKQGDKKYQRAIERQLRNRWPLTVIFLLGISFSIMRFFDKRSQWHYLFAYPPSYGIPIADSFWNNIATFVLLSFALLNLWMRVHEYRRDLLAAEQLALQKAASPPNGVWPPPPQQSI